MASSDDGCEWSCQSYGSILVFFTSRMTMSNRRENHPVLTRYVNAEGILVSVNFERSERQ